MQVLLFTFCCSDPPEVSVDYIITPAVEYTTRNLTCRISGGNPSDPLSYDYDWTYKPTYHVSAADIPRPYGMCLTSLVLIHLGFTPMIMGMNITFYNTTKIVRTCAVTENLNGNGYI